MALLTDVTLPESHEMIYVHAIFVGLALLFLFCSDIFVRCCHTPEPAQVNSSPTITNTIPFSTLNISIALTLLAILVRINPGKTEQNTQIQDEEKKTGCRRDKNLFIFPMSKTKCKFYFTKVSNENSKNSFNLKLTDSQIGSIGIRKI